MAAAVAAAEAAAVPVARGTAPVVEPQSDVNAALAIAFRAITRVLAIRLQLLLTLVADFVLAILAMGWQTQAGLWVLIAFCALTTAPLVWLEYSRPPRG